MSLIFLQQLGFLRGKPQLKYFGLLFHTSLDYLLAGFSGHLFRRAKQRFIAPLRQQSASDPCEDKTPFCNDKGTTCLTNPATQFDAFPVALATSKKHKKRRNAKIHNIILGRNLRSIYLDYQVFKVYSSECSDAPDYPILIFKVTCL